LVKLKILERNKRKVYYCVKENYEYRILIDNEGNIIQDNNKRDIIVVNEADPQEIYNVNAYREVYSKPFPVKLSFLPLAVNGEMLEVGLEYSKRISIYTTKEFAKKIHNGDRFFIFREPPKEYDKTCATADYYVHGEPSIYLTEATIYLRRMTGDVIE
jgi:hypothetical protein